MGCPDCNRRSVSRPQLAAAPAGLSLTVLQSRRDVCRQCDHASRNPAARFAVNAGLTSLSRCGKSGKRIADLTAESSGRCPLGGW